MAVRHDGKPGPAKSRQGKRVCDQGGQADQRRANSISRHARRGLLQERGGRTRGEGHPARAHQGNARRRLPAGPAAQIPAALGRNVMTKAALLILLVLFTMVWGSATLTPRSAEAALSCSKCDD